MDKSCSYTIYRTFFNQIKAHDIPNVTDIGATIEVDFNKGKKYCLYIKIRPKKERLKREPKKVEILDKARIL